MVVVVVVVVVVDDYTYPGHGRGHESRGGSRQGQENYGTHCDVVVV